MRCGPPGEAGSIYVLSGPPSALALLDRLRVGRHGFLSPTSVVTLPVAARAAARIPETAKYFGFAYPLADIGGGKLDEAAVDTLMAGGDAWASFILLGGFAYFDAERRIVGVNALEPPREEAGGREGAAGSGGVEAPQLRLEGPCAVTAAAAAELERQGRMHEVILPAFREESVTHFAWVGPAEWPGGQPLLDDGSKWEHGALVYRGGGDEPDTFVEQRTLCFRVVPQSNRVIQVIQMIEADPWRCVVS
jgi:hypothetical protein